MTPGGKRPYLDFQKYKYDENKRRPFFSFGKNKKSAKNLKIFESTSPPDPLGLNIGANPFRKEVKKKISYKKIFSGLIVFGFFVAWFWTMFYLPFFDIKQVGYSGIKNLNEQEIKDLVFEKFLKSGKYWHKNNFFILNTEKIAADISNNFELNDIKVEKIFPNRLQIDIREKKQSLIFCNMNGYYLLDHEGGVIKTFWQKEEIIPAELSTFTTNTSTIEQTDSITTTQPMLEEVKILKPDRKKIDTENLDLPLFCVVGEERLQKNQKNILSTDFINTIIDYQENLEKEGIGIVSYFIGQTNQWNSFEAHFGDKRWFLKLSTENTFTQIQKIKAMLNDKEKIAPTEYIDVRFGDRVFWK
ncbi:MAG TPA: FtsQ-type POTRA domain-containing protein [Candidatus Magasanikbacteria bacterium]|nr:FtsQ-type POTRA domain-containing protein [Candidatus Magasanikbacteria bacterium]